MKKKGKNRLLVHFSAKVECVKLSLLQATEDGRRAKKSSEREIYFRGRSTQVH